MTSQNNTDEEELRRIFSCKICYEPYSKHVRYPVSLHCGHSFCSVCIQNLFKDEICIQCGICRKVHFLNCHQLCKNITLTDILEHFNILIDDTADNAKYAETANDAEESVSQQIIKPTHLSDFGKQIELLESVLERVPLEHRNEFNTQLVQLKDDIKIVGKELHCATSKFLHLNRILAQLCGRAFELIVSSYQSGNRGAGDNFPLEFDDFVLPPVLSTPPPASSRTSLFPFDGNEWSLPNEVIAMSTAATTHSHFFGDDTPSTTNHSNPFDADDFWANGWSESVGNWDDGWMRELFETNNSTEQLQPIAANVGVEQLAGEHNHLPLERNPAPSVNIADDSNAQSQQMVGESLNCGPIANITEASRRSGVFIKVGNKKQINVSNNNRK